MWARERLFGCIWYLHFISSNFSSFLLFTAWIWWWCEWARERENFERRMNFKLKAREEISSQIMWKTFQALKQLGVECLEFLLMKFSLRDLRICERFLQLLSTSWWLLAVKLVDFFIFFNFKEVFNDLNLFEVFLIKILKKIVFESIFWYF